MLGSNPWYALMRRDLIYRRRYWIQSILELVLPWFFMHLLVKFKDLANASEAFKPHVIPPMFDSMPVQPLSFTDYVKALQAKRECSRLHGTSGNTSIYHITGMRRHTADWQVPFIRCDSRLCEYHGQPAYDYCEYNILALAPEDEFDEVGKNRVESFQDYIFERYPVLDPLGLAVENNTEVNLPFQHDFLKIFPSGDAIEAYIQNKDYGTVGMAKIALAVVFQGDDESEPDDSYVYTIRVNSTNNNNGEREGRPGVHSTPNTGQLFNSYAKLDLQSCMEPEMEGAYSQGPMFTSCTGLYIYNGFLTVQRLVQDWIFVDSGAHSDGYYVSEHGVQFMSFPSRQYKTAGFYEALQDFIPLFAILGLLYPMATMISYVVQEKELRQKELLKMMGATESDIGFSWFCTFLMWSSMAALLSANEATKLFDNSDQGFILLFWFLSFLSFIALSGFLASVCFHTTRSVLFGLLVHFSGYFISVSVDYQNAKPSKIYLASLHPVTAFCYGLQEVGRLEDHEVGVTWNTFDSTDSQSGYTFASSLIFLIGDFFLLTLLSWYFNRIMIPKDQGQAENFVFPFQKSYWFPGSEFKYEEISNIDDLELSTPLSQDSNDDPNEGIPQEHVSDALRQQELEGKSIEIKNLRKEFLGDSTTTVAVDDVTLSMYNGQITALLGHNGAGKTTLINLLTGAMRPTSGHAIVGGKNSVTQSHEIRQALGICLQHDCLFPELTVREHVQFFSRLKGAYQTSPSYRLAEEQVDATIRDVNLSDKSHTLSKNLSGGMKRKLSLANAFCGDSKIVFLDEPTSGMDPFSRRFTWDLIRHFRPGRCIILTTHFMDEADILGDRIAIMAEGSLQCVGSSLFLKKHYGVGYQLTIEKGGKTTMSEVEPSDEGNQNSFSDAHNSTLDLKLKSIVFDTVNEASLLTSVGAEMSFQLPLETSSKFVPMLRSLDNEVERGNISSYGVSMTTLDEVFLLVARSGMSVSNSHCLESPGEPTTNSRIELEREGLFQRHLWALFVKRASNFKRDKRAWCCTTILPTIFVLIGFAMLSYSDEFHNLEPLPLDINDYNIKVDQDPRNPIPFNSGDGYFLCQPGTLCAYSQPMVNEHLTKERYFFCGMESYLLNTPDCSINESNEVMYEIRNEGGIVPIGEDVSSFLEGLYKISNTSDVYAASQYGALFFSHEPNSVMKSGQPYGDTVVGHCKNMTSLIGQYMPEGECENYGGIGYIVSYNFTAIHAAPLYQTIADEAILRYALQKQDFKISTTIHPLPRTKSESASDDKADSLNIWFNLVLSFPFVAGAFATFVVTERESKAKHLQTVSGVQPSAYWLSTFLWDIMNYQIPLWLTLGLIFGFDVEVFTTKKRGAVYGVVSLLALFGPASASFSYFVSFFFTSASLCNIFVIITGFFIGMAGPMAEFILRLLSASPIDSSVNFSKKAKTLELVGRFFPSFCLGNGLFNIINIETLEDWNDEKLTVWSDEIMKWEVICLVLQSIFYLFLAIQFDRLSTKPNVMQVAQRILAMLRSMVKGRFGQPADECFQDEEDVALEEERVNSGNADDDMIVLKDIRKVYSNGKVAVEGMTLGIPPGECFGLLGTNGAGKTTVMGVLTAEFAPSEGDASLAGFSVSHEPEQTRRRIGYCPQFDAHFTNLTGREHVELYASIKGVPKRLVKEASAAKLSEVGLSPADSNRMSSKYSGGMKRRLSLACATIGQPEILFLDECSTGVDPFARREIWQMISAIVSQKKTSVILTTHMMEECEALCPRIGIMANGRLRCLGSAQRLKSKFGRGYQLELKVSTVDRDNEEEEEDYKEVRQLLSQQKRESIEEEAASRADNIFFALHEVQAALVTLSGDTSLSRMVTSDNPHGFPVFRDANSFTGVSLSDLTNFATMELRIRNVAKYISSTFPRAVFRERQDVKVRYEVSNEDAGIADIFASIEENKGRLKLADYGVSQTSLEQVFNIHAEEAATTEFLGQNARTFQGSNYVAAAGSDEEELLVV